MQLIPSFLNLNNFSLRWNSKFSISHASLHLSLNRVLDLRHIILDPDPDPKIRPTDLRIRILLFSSGVADKMPPKNKYCFQRFLYFFVFEGTFIQVFIDKKSKRKSQNSRNQGFSNFFCLLMEGCRPRSRSGSVCVQSNDGSGSGRPKNIRIGIHNTVSFPTHVPGKPLAMPIPTIVLRSAGGLGCVWGGGWRADTHHMA